MAPATIQQLLKETIGLDAESIGPSAIDRAVRDRQIACDAQDAQAYFKRLLDSEAERQALIEALVVPETWFFRDRDAFAAFGAIAAREWKFAGPDRPRRVLSVPCSTGEEPYSIAMTLQEAGFLPHSVRIDAIDISQPLLARARSGVYGQNSFRGSDLAFRARHFDPVGGGYRIHDDLRTDVQFHHGNLLSPAFLADAEPYDAVFCRNLLIYFDRDTQERAINTVERLLRADGVLFVGASEAAALLYHDLVSAGVPMSFAFRRRRAEQERESPARQRARPIREFSATVPFATAPRVRTPAVAAARAAVVTPAVPAVPAQAVPAGALDEAYRLADQGHFAEAATRCESYLKERGPSERAFYLLGLVRDASGNALDAEAYYRKTLYLDPHHRPALAHLALLMDRLGKKAEAQLLRDRMRRLESTDRSA